MRMHGKGDLWAMGGVVVEIKLKVSCVSSVGAPMKAGCDNAASTKHVHTFTLRAKKKQLTTRRGTTLRKRGLGTSCAQGVVKQT